MLIVEDIEGIAEVKLDQRRGAGRHRVHYPGAANLNLTLNVEANELFEARRGLMETDAQHGFTPSHGETKRARVGYCARESL
jgi:hypothetical protein